MSREDFDPLACLIPTVYCGTRDNIPVYKVGDKTIYTAKGNVKQCMQKGFGAGRNSVKIVEGNNDLKNIPYIGEKYEKNFKKLRPQIKNIDELEYFCKVNNKTTIRETLRKALIKKNGVVDEKAYNSVLRYLYDTGISKLPVCTKLY